MATLKKLVALTKKLATLTPTDLVSGETFYQEHLNLAKAVIAYECNCECEDISDEEAELSEEFEELHNVFAKELSEEVEEIMSEVIVDLTKGGMDEDRALMTLDQILIHSGTGRLFTTSEYLTFFELNRKLNPLKNEFSTICYIWG